MYDAPNYSRAVLIGLAGFVILMLARVGGVL